MQRQVDFGGNRDTVFNFILKFLIDKIAQHNLNRLSIHINSRKALVQSFNDIITWLRPANAQKRFLAMDYQTSDDFSPLLLIDMLTSGATKSQTTATPLQFGDTDLIEARYNFGSFLTRLIRRQYTTPEINCFAIRYFDMYLHHRQNERIKRKTFIGKHPLMRSSSTSVLPEFSLHLVSLGCIFLSSKIHSAGMDYLCASTVVSLGQGDYNVMELEVVEIVSRGCRSLWWWWWWLSLSLPLPLLQCLTLLFASLLPLFFFPPGTDHNTRLPFDAIDAIRHLVGCASNDGCEQCVGHR